MTLTVHMKQHDTAPPLELVAIEAGEALDLSVYTAAKLLMRRRGATALKVNASAQIDAAASTVRYLWTAADTNESGVFFAEFELSEADGRKRTLPAEGHIRVEIWGDLDGA